MYRIPAICVALALLLAGAVMVSTDSPASAVAEGGESFGGYWYQGKAEVSRFELDQARYGETHRGDAVLIFVTEDFLPKRQVKADDADRTRSGAWPVLKLNFTKKFNTGLYPYSIMSSVFTPIDLAQHPRSLKTTTSIQEWCGQTFVQLNHRDSSYHVSGFSYFQSEGDREFDLDSNWLEDEIWTRIRIDPSSLPSGKVTMIPGSQQHRLRHEPLRALTAEISSASEGEGVIAYTISYPQSKRSLVILYREESPHRIEGWRESYMSRGREITTKARRTHTMMLDYWNKNSTGDAPLRTKLGL